MVSWHNRARMPPRLDRKICLLRRTKTADGAGAPVELWSEVADMWAGLVELRGAEAVSSGAMRAELKLGLRIRYLRCLNSISAPGEYRVRYNSATYDVLSVVEDLKQPRQSFQLLTLSHVEGQPTLSSVPVV